MKCRRPFVALPICRGWVAILLAEGEVGADTTAHRVIEIATRLDAARISLSIVPVRTNVDNFVCVGILGSLTTIVN